MTVDDFLADWHSNSEGIWVHTSGTTGIPKPMYVLKQHMRNSARATCDFLGLQPGDGAFLCMSVDYIAGKMMVVRSLERQLQLIQVPPSGHPLHDVAVSQARASLAAMVPLQVYNSLQVPAEREQLQRFTHVIIGGGAIDAQLEAQLQSFPNAIWSSYGMTETLSHVALRRVNGACASLWYQPMPGVKVSLDENDCLVIDAPAVHDGALHTHDIATLRQDGCFRILGRRDNVICSGGIKLQAEAIEQRLQPWLEAPFAITKRADEKFGEVVVLVTTATDLEQVKAICVAQLPKYWQPHVFVHADVLPLTPTGKVARTALLTLAKKV